MDTNEQGVNRKGPRYGVNVLEEFVDKHRQKHYQRLFSKDYHILDKPIEALRRWIPESEFIFTAKTTGDNFLIHILFNYNKGSIAAIIEFGSLLEYHEQYHPNHSRKLVNKGGSFDHIGLLTTLHEISAAKLVKILFEQDVRFGETYKKKNGVIKPLDGTFDIDEVPYVVEAGVVRNRNKELFIDLGRLIIDQLLTNKMLYFWSIKGYLGFRSLKTIETAREVFVESSDRIMSDLETAIEERTVNFDNIEHIVKMPPKIQTQEYNIVFEYHRTSEHHPYKQLSADFPMWAQFAIGNESLTKGYFKINLQYPQNTGEVEEKIIKKVREKTSQHGEFEGGLLVVVGMYTFQYAHSENLSTWGDLDDLNYVRIQNALKANVSVLLVHHTYTYYKQEIKVSLVDKVGLGRSMTIPFGNEAFV